MFSENAGRRAMLEGGKLMRMLKPLAIVLGSMVLGLQAYAAEDLTSLPRNQTLIARTRKARSKTPAGSTSGRSNAGGQSTGLQQLGMDTLWYIDPGQGINGVWENSLASEKPIYNKDFTEMTVKLRDGSDWSDGVEFTADDVVYTIEEHLKTEGLRLDPAVPVNVDSVSAPDKYTVVFKLKKPNSRFHALFTVRWNAMWIMPKHVFEKQPGPAEVRLQSAGDARSLHAAQLRSGWRLVYLAEARRLAEHVARPVRRTRAEICRLYRSRPAGQARDRSAQPPARHHPRHLRPRACSRWPSKSKTSHGWFKGFPYAHPDPTLPVVMLNHQLDKFKKPRRALGAGAADRHQGGRYGLLSRRGDDFGDLACRRPAPIRSSTSSRWSRG